MDTEFHVNDKIVFLHSRGDIPGTIIQTYENGSLRIRWPSGMETVLSKEGRAHIRHFGQAHTYDPSVNYAEKLESLGVGRRTSTGFVLGDADRRCVNCKAGQVPCIGVTPCRHLAQDQEHQCNHRLEFDGDGANLSIGCELEFGHDNFEFPDRQRFHRHGVVLWDGRNAKYLPINNIMLTTEEFRDE
jgi:hypothetical protein